MVNKWKSKAKKYEQQSDIFLGALEEIVSRCKTGVAREIALQAMEEGYDES